jgi:hypothetical protein
MRAQTAAAYVDEKSVETFRRSVGTLYPLPVKLAGKGDRWLKDDLDAAIEMLTGRMALVRDAADVLWSPRAGPGTCERSGSEMAALPTSGNRRRYTCG